MLTLSRLREVITEAFENDEWICLKSGGCYSIFKINSKEHLEYFTANLIEEIDSENVASVHSNEDGSIYTDVERAKDWNFFKNTMAI